MSAHVCSIWDGSHIYPGHTLLDRKKKKVIEEHDSDSDHGDFDATQLREHEEFTKVRSYP